ncbi:MAG: glutamyl-Q tRNA(Asp) synthetase [Phycisphaerae bacterium]|jgi:glutamyl-tRNA synthetase|nr:MAG: glutamyl-Q tRNA(Asp) synthetase [Phycisphaerae bacterium]
MIPTTRLAPSPTGALHLGNARTFLATWLLARQKGFRVILRIEDLDGPRVKPQFTQQAIDDLTWLGIDWDEGPVIQSEQVHVYYHAVQQLLEAKQAYPCVCTRKEIEQASSAPHSEDGSTIYPGTCRNRFDSVDQAYRQTGKRPAVRFKVPPTRFRYEDQFAGVRSFDLQEQIGDFVIAKPDGSAAYQLAVVVDDARSGVNQVIRGDDLIDSVPRQVLLYQSLGWDNLIPHYYHLPLVVGPDGRRLAKRHGDSRLAFYRQSGVCVDRIRALLARWLGMDCDDSISIDQCLTGFDLKKVPRDPIVFSPRDHEWILRKS